VVGTFRISQPGSSVATSLVAGESVQKKIGLLDIRGTNFRLRPIPLTQVRTFAMGEVSLAEHQGLNPNDTKVEEKVKQVLKEEVQLLLHQAKQKARELVKEARKHGNLVAGAAEYPLENRLRKPQEVLVRLKVEYAGFSAVNNHRFGANFVGEIANTVSDVSGWGLS
jgi:double-strand break repair protein MRE11